MINPFAERTELEEMVVSSPYDTVFIAPTFTPEETVWSFLVHERRDVVRSVDEVMRSGSLEGDRSGARCIKITLSSESRSISILALLFRFETSPPAMYSLFLNPSDPSVSELLKDLSKQGQLTFDLYDERHVVRRGIVNDLRDCMREALEASGDGGQVADETFDFAIESLTSGQLDTESLWELSGLCFGDGAGGTG